jgi:O-antigen/teichoic acid export membrane protein
MTATSGPDHVAVSSTTAPVRAGTGRSGTSSALPHRFGRNVAMNYAAQATAAVSAIVLTPLLLHHLGRSAFGVWVLASSVVVYLELFELGFGGATTKLIAENASARPEQALRTLNTTFFALIPLGLVAMVAGVGMAFAFPVVMHVPPHLHDQVIVVVLVLAFGLSVSIPGDTFGGALMGHQRYDLLGLSNSLLVASTFVASIVIVELGGGLIPLAVALTTIGILFHFVRFAMVRRVAKGTRISVHLADWSQLRSVMGLSGWFLLNGVLQAIYNACDVVVVGIVLGIRAAAVYGVASKLAVAATTGLDSLAAVFFPYASSVARNKDRGALTEITVDGTRAAMFVGMLICLLYVILASPGIRIWVGVGYGTSARVLVVLALAIALCSPIRVSTMVLAGSGRLPLVCGIRGVETVINLALSISLALVIGPVGVAVGTLGAILLVRLPGFLFVGGRAIGVPALTLVRRSVVPHLPPMVACAAVLLALRGVAGRSLAGLVLAVAAGTLVYTAVYFAVGATKGERRRALAAVSSFVPARWRPDLGESFADVEAHAGS